MSMRCTNAKRCGLTATDDVHEPDRDCPCAVCEAYYFDWILDQDADWAVDEGMTQ
jgi:hypothetical protein